MKKNKIYRCKDRIMRVLEEREGRFLVVDCVKKTMPRWINCLDLEDSVEISEEKLREELGTEIPETTSAMASREMQKRFAIIAGILPYVEDKKKRSLFIRECAERYGVSQNTVKNYLMAYLVYQDMVALAPKEKAEKRELTKDEKNMRWALNKFYYTRQRQSLKTAYTLMLKEKYCDTEGKLKEEYPSIYQFRYFYEKTKKLQNLYISRDGLKDYQRNKRPLLGDGANVMMCPEIMKKAYGELGEPFYVLPSSTHEVLLVRESAGMKPSQLADMIKEVNLSDSVRPEDLLSYQVFRYDGRKLSVAREDIKKAASMVEKTLKGKLTM